MFKPRLTTPMDPDCSLCEGMFGFDALACAMERSHWNRIAFVQTGVWSTW